MSERERERKRKGERERTGVKVACVITPKFPGLPPNSEKKSSECLQRSR